MFLIKRIGRLISLGSDKIKEINSDSFIVDFLALYKECKKVGIDFFTSPYSFKLVNHVDKYIPAYKIGSGDITYTEIIKFISKKKKASYNRFWSI